ncbi:MAG: aldehyde dehydrogenase family protein [Pseudomonas sp.]
MVVVNPATEERLAELPASTSADLDEAVQAGQRALAGWQADIGRRRQVLLDCAEALAAHADELARLLTLEQGKPLPKARREVMGSAAWLRYTATLELPVEIARDDEVTRIEVHRRPLGVVAGIIPWNYPLMTAIWKIAPALLAGNAIIIKPSPFTPLATVRMGEILDTIVPAGVLRVLVGGDELGRAISAHPEIAKVSFTGSTVAGRHVAASAGQGLKRVTLELGGNDAAIVLDDVDPRQVAQKLFWGAFENSGQVCVAIKRLYLHARIHDVVVEELIALATRTHLGNGLDEGVELGPLCTRPQFDRVLELIEDARVAGGLVVTGGRRVGERGYFIAPTLVTGLDAQARLVAEEQFGPVLPCLRFDEVEQAVAAANASPYGLAGSVWSSDPSRAAAVAAQLQCGTAWINAHIAIVPQAPIEGCKASGVGVENGLPGLYGYTRLQTVVTPKS